MKRKYIYIIVILLTISLSTAEFYINKDLQKIIPQEDSTHAFEDTNAVKEVTTLTSITIKNEQNSDEEITYKYTINIPSISGAYRYKYDVKEGYIVFTANGEASFELKSNESLEIYDIPTDLNYTITQETLNDKYTTKVGEKEASTYNGKTTTDNSITFNNSTKSTEKKTPEQPQKEDKKAKKKEIPNTGETEMKMTLVLLISLLIIYCFRKIRVKRFE